MTQQSNASGACIAILVEDRQSRLALDMTLRRAGYRTVLFESGEDLLSFLAGHASASDRPDVLVADIEMPGGKGCKLISELAEQALCLPAVIVTAQDIRQFEAELGERECFCYLRKPFHPEDLLDAVSTVIRQVGKQMA